METPHGFLLIDKPVEWTSFDVVAKLRRITGVRKIGHAGTLDPFATGLLIVAVGRQATREIDRFVKQDKIYETELQLGSRSTTHDPEGEITTQTITEWPEQDAVDKVVQSFVGNIEQVPPMHAAIKINGKKLYELAREGKTVERPPRAIVIHDITVNAYNPPALALTVHCGSGTYIRALARDIGDALTLGAYCTQLRRTKIGNVSIENALTIDQITPDNWHTHLQQL